MRKFVALGAFAALIGGGYFAVTEASARIQKKVTTMVQAEIQKNPGWRTVDAAVDGRSVSLSGTAPTEQARKAVIQRIAAVKGVHAVDAKGLTVRASDPGPGDPVIVPKPVAFDASWQAGKLTVTGALPGEDLARRVRQKVTTAFGDGDFAIDLEASSAGPTDAQTIKRVMAVIEALSQLQSGAAKIRGEKVEIDGVVVDAATEQQIRRAVTARMADPKNLRLALRVAVAPAAPDVSDGAADVAAAAVDTGEAVAGEDAAGEEDAPSATEDVEADEDVAVAAVDAGPSDPDTEPAVDTEPAEEDTAAIAMVEDTAAAEDTTPAAEDTGLAAEDTVVAVEDTQTPPDTTPAVADVVVVAAEDTATPEPDTAPAVVDAVVVVAPDTMAPAAPEDAGAADSPPVSLTAASPLSNQQCQDALMWLVAGDKRIKFDGRNRVKDEDIITVDQAARLLKRCPDAKVTVQGFSDSYGEPDALRRRTRRQAYNVRQMLVERGIAAERLAYKGYGYNRARYSNVKATRHLNRRIEFKIAGATQ